jgi:Mrp family chromosome partitioning ATPase
MALQEAKNKAMTSKQDQASQELARKQRQVRERIARIKHKILVLSGKGGVGKSTVAVNLALYLTQAGKKVGLLDVDIHGPSIPTLLHLEDRPLSGAGETWLPVELDNHLKVISIGFLLPNPDAAVIWRGPMKYKMIQRFIKDVEWGELDFLIVDSPPGTGDEPLSIAQLIEDADGAVMVTTPQHVAISDVRKAITFCRQLHLPVLGVLENMSGFVCPHCGKRVDIFNQGGGEVMARDMDVPFLGRLPIDPAIVQAGDEGIPFIQAFADSEAAKAFGQAINPLLQRLE